MTLFRFDYEAVLEHRCNMEDVVQRELAKLLRERMVLENQLRGLRQAVRDDRSALAGALVGSVDVVRVQQHAAYAAQSAARAGQIAGRMQALDRRIADARRRFAEAIKRRKAIERLRDKRYRVWHAQQTRREAADLEPALAAVAGEV